MLPLVDQFYIVAASVGFLFVTAGFVIGQMDNDGGVDTGAVSGDAGGGDFGGVDSGGAGGGDFGGVDSGDAGGGDFGGVDSGDAGGGDFGGADSPQALGRATVAAIKSGGLMQGARTGSSPLMFILKLLSPTTIATFLFCFGATGLVIKRTFPALGDLSLVPAIIFGYIGNRMLSGAMGWVTRKLHSSTNFREEDMIGTPADVTVSIPQGRTGEITYLVGSVRHTAPARNQLEGVSLAGSARVIIADIRDGIFYVEPFDDGGESGRILQSAPQGKPDPRA